MRTCTDLRTLSDDELVRDYGVSHEFNVFYFKVEIGFLQ